MEPSTGGKSLNKGEKAMLETTAYNPIRNRKLIWRGGDNWIGIVSAFGTPCPDPSGDRTLVPVMYTSGEYAILAAQELKIGRAFTATRAWELRAQTEECARMIRTTRGMPSIVAVYGDSIKIGVTDGANQGYVRIRRDVTSVVKEEIVLV